MVSLALPDCGSTDVRCGEFCAPRRGAIRTINATAAQSAIFAPLNSLRPSIRLGAGKFATDHLADGSRLAARSWAGLCAEHSPGLPGCQTIWGQHRSTVMGRQTWQRSREILRLRDRASLKSGTMK